MTDANPLQADPLFRITGISKVVIGENQEAQVNCCLIHGLHLSGECLYCGEGE